MYVCHKANNVLSIYISKIAKKIVYLNAHYNELQRLMC